MVANLFTYELMNEFVAKGLAKLLSRTVTDKLGNVWTKSLQKNVMVNFTLDLC